MIEVVLDTETTGLSVSEGHRIVEIGCIEIVDQVPTENIFHYYINPNRKVSNEAFKVHGYSDDFLKQQKSFSEIVDEFINFILNKQLVIHNAPFDLAFLNSELRMTGKKSIDTSKVVDTLELAKAKFPGSGVSLDALCKRYKIDNSKREKHSALVDCELLTKVYVNLIGQKEPKLDFNLEKNKKNLHKDTNIEKVNYSKKIIQLSDEELKLHKSFIKNNLKKNFF